MLDSHQFLKIFSLPVDIMRVLYYIKTQKKFLRNNIQLILDDALQKNDGSLDDADINKINHYYGLAVPAILGEAFCALRGKEMSAAERWTSTSQGAMTGLFDDFFDKEYMSDDSVAEMIKEAKRPVQKKSNEKLFDIFYKNALQYSPDKKTMQDTLLKVYQAQVESKKQQNGLLSHEALLKLTFEKGGNSVNFYRTAFYPPATKAELQLFYNLGGLMQLGNDIFDVYKDREGNIQTLITAAKHIDPIRIFLKTKLKEYYRDSYQLGYSKKNVRAFLNIISIAIFSRCFVCLDQLEQNEKLSSNEFIVEQYSRKQLVCDMDKKINMLRSAWSNVTDIRITVGQATNSGVNGKM